MNQARVSRAGVVVMVVVVVVVVVVFVGHGGSCGGSGFGSSSSGGGIAPLLPTVFSPLQSVCMFQALYHQES
jgi:hypothetical protein